MAMTSDRFGITDDSPASSPSSEAHRLELEAAEALAVLAHTVTHSTTDGGGESQSGRNWGGKKKRRVKSESLESTPNASAHSHVADFVNTSSDLVPQNERVAAASPEVSKVEMPAEYANQSPSRLNTQPSSGGSKSRQMLTEEEKEGRRLRRILANRESARQTIRRRQALCEELTKRAADLTWENDNLRREKELALKEFHSLELTNKRLKTQMSKVKVEESRNRTVCSDKYESSGGLRTRHMFPPVDWSPHVQSGIVRFRNEVNRELKWDCHENGLKGEDSKPQMYLFQGPWFIPVNSSVNGFLPPSSGFSGTSEGDFRRCGPSSDGAVLENLFPTGVKMETSSPTHERAVNDLNEGSDDWLLTSLALGPATAQVPPKSGTSSLSENCSGNDFCLSANQGRQDFVCGNLRQSTFEVKQLVDAATAANARRKRKELTRLKNHGRQCKTNC